jgi:ornithine carbamoyltransferase
MQTMLEHSEKPRSQISYAFVGDARNNMGHSLLMLGAIMGCDVRMVAPKENQPGEHIMTLAQERAKDTHARITVTDDVAEGVRGVDFIHTDVWVSMGEPAEVWESRIKALTPYRVDMEMLRKTGNPEIKVMHCLPAFHNTETRVGREIAEKFGITEMEVTEEVFESHHTIAFEQAENRMHTIKAVLVATMGS